MRPSTGRPTRAQAEARGEEMLNRALDMFLEHGFEQTTVEDIAVDLGMSKRTVYARHADKPALFKAAVRRAIDRYTVPLEKLLATEAGSLEATLKAVAHLRIANLSTPESIKLQRILLRESYRFPELHDAFFEEAVRPTIDFLCAQFERHHTRGEIDVGDPRRAAAAFLSLVVGGPARLIVSGHAPTQAELEERVRFAVRLFLNGVRKR